MPRLVGHEVQRRQIVDAVRRFIVTGGDVITYELAIGTPAAPDPEIPTGLTSGSSAPVGPWRLTLSDYTLAGDHYEVTVTARNDSYQSADLTGLRFFGGSTNRNGFTDSNKQASWTAQPTMSPRYPGQD